jgi:hypothetical protein
MATRKPRRFGDGGSTDKEEGLKASKDEKVGFFERLRMGNIDQEGSEAYNRFGAGRGKAERAKNVPVEDRVATPVKRETEDDAKPSKAMRDRAEEQGKTQGSGDASVAEMYQGPRTKPVSSTPAKKPAADKAPAKSEAKAPAKAATSDYSNEGRSTPTAKKDTSGYSNEGRGREMSKKQQVEREIDSIRPTEKQTQEGLETATSMMGGAGLKALHGAAKKLAGTGAKKAAESGGSRALSTAVDDGVTYLGKSGRRQVGGFDELGAAAKKLADGRKAAIAREGAATLANNPTKRIGGPSKANLVAKNRAARDAARKDAMTKENADRYGLDPKSPDYMDKAKSVRDNLGGSDFSLGMKKGGAVKGWGMARGARKAKMR